MKLGEQRGPPPASVQWKQGWKEPPRGPREDRAGHRSCGRRKGDGSRSREQQACRGGRGLRPLRGQGRKFWRPHSREQEGRYWGLGRALLMQARGGGDSTVEGRCRKGLSVPGSLAGRGRSKRPRAQQHRLAVAFVPVTKVRKSTEADGEEKS